MVFKFGKKWFGMVKASIKKIPEIKKAIGLQINTFKQSYPSITSIKGALQVIIKGSEAYMPLVYLPLSTLYLTSELVGLSIQIWKTPTVRGIIISTGYISLHLSSIVGAVSRSDSSTPNTSCSDFRNSNIAITVRLMTLGSRPFIPVLNRTAQEVAGYSSEAIKKFKKASSSRMTEEKKFYRMNKEEFENRTNYLVSSKKLERMYLEDLTNQFTNFLNTKFDDILRNHSKNILNNRSTNSLNNQSINLRAAEYNNLRSNQFNHFINNRLLNRPAPEIDKKIAQSMSTSEQELALNYLRGSFKKPKATYTFDEILQLMEQGMTNPQQNQLEKKIRSFEIVKKQVIQNQPIGPEIEVITPD